MKKKLFTAMLVVLITIMISSSTAFALLSLSNGMEATLVLGQTDFASNASSTTQTGMHLPLSVSVDPTSGKVFVADYANNRVLRFGSLTTLSNGAAAEAVLGQSDFTSNASAATQNGMSHPDGLAVDSAGRLWVADIYNNRVLRFDNAASKANGANADGVLGQPNFTSNASATTQNGMNYPNGLAVDSGGRLWVADAYNNRVLRFDAAASRANGANADGVLGQANFTSNISATTQSGMNGPWDVVADTAGRLWVVEYYNQRVLRFDGAALRANGANADGVLGQPNFTSAASATTQSGMSRPMGVTVDATGRLWVADRDNNRVLVFTNAAAKANGGNADFVLGQTNFISSGIGISASGLYGPRHPFYDPAADVLWIPDGFNNRVLMYGTPANLTISGNASVGGAVLSYYDGMDKTAAANSGGDYSFTVSYSWSGTVTPSKPGYIFSPDHRGYSNVKTDQPAQNYTATAITYTISGNTGIGGATLNYTDGTSKTAAADASGNYSFAVSYNWSGMVTPSLTGYSFSPDHRGYTNVLMDQTAQNYTAAANISTVVFNSIGAQDGWVLESTETSNKGGTSNAAAPTLRLGDDAAKKQYRSVLSFSCGAGLPDNAVITKVTFKVKKNAVIGGGNPATTFQGFMVDVKKGVFGTTALQVSDFQTVASKSYGPFKPALTSGWYSIDLTSAKDYINKLGASSGLTQIRLRFKLGDNNNGVANYLSLYSGNGPATSRPQLIIEYYVP